MCWRGPIHGGWSSWSGYGSCSKSCGSGSQSRSRSCNNPSPAYGGNSCSGASISSRSCNTHNCPKIDRAVTLTAVLFTADGPVGLDMDRAPSPVVPDPSPGVVAVITPPRRTAVTPARGPLPPLRAVTHTTVQFTVDGPVGLDMDRAPSPVVLDLSPEVVAVITPPQLTAVTPARGPLPPLRAVTHTTVQFTVDGPVGLDMDRAPSPVVPGPSPGVVAVITPPQLTAVTPARGPLPPPRAVIHITVQRTEQADARFIFQTHKQAIGQGINIE
uniref:Hemicentin-1 n=1 Tax=Magallana gigas TaxID=29159 RepID=K1PFK2_MAGGI